VEYLVLSKACVTDMLLCVITLYAFLCFFYSRFPASAVLLGLAVLTKGPVGVFLPLAIIGIYLVLTKGLKKLKEMPLLLCAAVFLAVSLPWYFFAYKTHGKEFIDIFFGFHNITRFLAPEHASGDVFYYYVPLTIASFFPWVAFLPMAAWQALREKEAGIRKANIFLVVWFFVIFTFFSISRTKLPTYTFGFFPALALLTARLFDVFSEEGLTLKMRRGMTVSIVLFLILIISGIVGLCAVAASKYPSAAPASYAAGSVFVLLMVFFTATLLMRKYRASSIICILSFLIFLLPIYYVVMPEIARYESSKEIAGRLAVLMKPGEPLGAETRYVRGIAFYTGKEDVLDVHAHHVITKFLDRDERVWCVVKEKNYNQLYDLYDDNRKPYDKPTYVLYKLGKKVIVTNKMPPGLTYLQMREKSK
jgi:4-amino-4-deoxy-L-arabinose transferase-like glycosyltransferase